MTPEDLLQQESQRVSVILLLSELQPFLRQYEAGWHLLAEAQAERLPVQGLSERLAAVGQVLLTQLLPQPAAARRAPTLPEHIALLQGLPGWPHYALAALSAGLPLPAEVQ